MLRATITTGQSALKSSLLINGGAALAILAFIGKIWSVSEPIPYFISLSLLYYVLGVLSGAVASGFTYISQAGYAEEFGKYSNNIGLLGHFVAIFGVMLAYILFISASFLAYQAIVNG